MTWADKIKNWENGLPQKYPKYLITTDGFMWKTYTFGKDMNNIYKEKFILSNFPIQDTQQYNYYIDDAKKRNVKNVTSFFSSSGNLLIIPMPRDSRDIAEKKDVDNVEKKDFRSIKHFIDNACEEKQIAFWKYVSEKIKNYDYDSETYKFMNEKKNYKKLC
jgi:hypothetical protein